MAYDILIVDDEADIRMLVAGILEDEGYQTREAGNSDDALAAVQTRGPALVLLDIWLQGSALDGLGILQEITARNPNLPVVMMSGHGTIETAVQAIKDGAYDFVEKPFQADRLLLIVERAIEAARLREENAELRLRAGPETQMIGASPAISQVRQSIEKVAPTNSRVLITGGPGSGKEVAARLLHMRSRRAEGPFVVVNCATMAPDQVEKTLFGLEEEGQIQQGTFERADGGTLLLDEVADMPMETQGKIVRILQEQRFQRVGGAARVEVDVRVIASSTRDLTEEIAAGHFREDLYYRLSVVPISMPALNRRREDIPQLARYFMERAEESTGQPPRRLGEDALAALQAHEWPGNVRELRNIIERLLIMAPGDANDAIKADALPSEIHSTGSVTLGWDRGGEIMALPLREARELFERQYLTAQVERFGGNISRTSAFIGMERSALHRKLKSLGIQGEERGRKG